MAIGYRLRKEVQTGWGLTRILGELKKLGIRSVGRTTVVAILREAGIDPGPTRGDGSWDEFLKIHADSLWACDFLTKKVWTTAGLKDYFILFFINVATRRVFVSGMTPTPDSIWMAHQARGIAMHFQDQPIKPTYVLRDGDKKFTAEFCSVLESEGLEVKRVGPMAPNMNAYAERWVQTLKSECLDHFVVLGEAHLRYIVSEFVTHYLEERPHQAKDNLPLVGESPPETVDVIRCEELVCRKRLGGLLKSYSRKAG